MINSRDPGSADGKYPIVMGGTFVDIPAVVITKPDGDLIKAALSQGLTVSITPDTTPALAEFNGTRGWNNNWLSFRVAKPGLYPFRLVTYEGGSDASVSGTSSSATATSCSSTQAIPRASRSIRSAPCSRRLTRPSASPAAARRS